MLSGALPSSLSAVSSIDSPASMRRTLAWLSTSLLKGIYCARSEVIVSASLAIMSISATGAGGFSPDPRSRHGTSPSLSSGRRRTHTVPADAPSVELTAQRIRGSAAAMAGEPSLGCRPKADIPLGAHSGHPKRPRRYSIADIHPDGCNSGPFAVRLMWVRESGRSAHGTLGRVNAASRAGSPRKNGTITWVFARRAVTRWASFSRNEVRDS